MKKIPLLPKKGRKGNAGKCTSKYIYTGYDGIVVCVKLISVNKYWSFVYLLIKFITGKEK